MLLRLVWAVSGGGGGGEAKHGLVRETYLSYAGTEEISKGFWHRKGIVGRLRVRDNRGWVGEGA